LEFFYLGKKWGERKKRNRANTYIALFSTFRVRDISEVRREDGSLGKW
jgi:hypothetical protein